MSEIEKLELKNTISEMKNSLGGLNNRTEPEDTQAKLRT